MEKQKLITVIVKQMVGNHFKEVEISAPISSIAFIMDGMDRHIVYFTFNTNIPGFDFTKAYTKEQF